MKIRVLSRGYFLFKNTFYIITQKYWVKSASVRFGSGYTPGIHWLQIFHSYICTVYVIFMRVTANKPLLNTTALSYYLALHFAIVFIQRENALCLDFVFKGKEKKKKACSSPLCQELPAILHGSIVRCWSHSSGLRHKM